MLLFIQSCLLAENLGSSLANLAQRVAMMFRKDKHIKFQDDFTDDSQLKAISSDTIMSNNSTEVPSTPRVATRHE